MFAKLKNKAEVFRSFVFGVEDSLVSTIGLLSGVAVAGVGRTNIVITGIILVLVEAMSMGVGEILSEHTTQSLEKKKEAGFGGSLRGGFVMFISYVVAGAIPILPYYFLDANLAFWLSIILSLFFLFVLGLVSSISHQHKKFIYRLRHGLEMLVLGGLVILVGTLVGSLVSKI